jgi:hypothetical protein
MVRRSWMRRLERDAMRDRVTIHLRDGSTKIFPEMDVWSEMVLTRLELFRHEARSSEILDAVRQATPASRAAFEAEYGPIEMHVHVVAGAHEGGWVDEHRLLEDGSFETIHYEDGSEKAERIKREMKQGWHE